MRRKISIKQLTALGLFLLFYQISTSQRSPFYFEHLMTEEGLSQNDINCIFQDRNGFMWFGTNDGLNKYDGYEFTIYNPYVETQHQISSNLIFSIDADSQDRLWIGTTGKGLDMFDPRNESFINYKHDPDDPKSLRNNYISQVLVDRYDKLWVATNEGLDLMFTSNPEAGFHHLSLNPKDVISNAPRAHINAIFEDFKGNIFVGTNSGAYHIINPETSEDFSTSIVEPIFKRKPVSSFNQDIYGKLIIGTPRGLFYEQEPKKFVQIADGANHEIVIDDENNIWTGTSRGIYFFEAYKRGESPKLSDIFQSNPYNSNYLSKNNIKSVFKDTFGLIWIGTNGGGINKVNPKRKPFFHFKKTLNPSSLSYNKIRAIFEDSYGTIWIGTEGGGLNRQHSDQRNNQYNNFSVLGDSLKVFSLQEYQKGANHYLLVGTENSQGFFYVDITNNPAELNTNQLKRVPEIRGSVFSLLEDRKKNIWIGTYSHGLYKWESKDIINKNVFKRYTYDPVDSNSLPNRIIRSLLEDSKGNIWIGTGNGLSRLSAAEATREQPKFETFKNDSNNPNSISHNYILALHEDRQGNLWIGTFGGGLNKFIPENDSRESHFIRYTSQNGLPNNVVKSILEDDDGNLWLATNKGLSRFNPKDASFINFDVNDGLQSNEFSELASFRLNNGEMLFGGVNGFNAFVPNDIRINLDIPLVAITELSILNEPVKVGERVNGRVLLPNAITHLEEIKLKSAENSFSLEFAGLHYAAPTKNQYAYKLEGFDKEWINTDSKKRFATYTNLSPGSYTFFLKASNNDGNWSDPIHLEITITPPLWRTWYAYILYAVLFFFMLWLFRRYTLIGVAEKHKLMIEHIEKEQAEELHQMKLKFFTNISHELRTPLTLIIGPLENLLKQKRGVKDEEQQEFQLMYKNSRYLLRLVNQLLDFRKLDQGKMKLSIQNNDIVQFIEEVTEPFQFLSKKKNIHYEIVSLHERYFAWFDSNVLEKIIYNLLSNAFKFTPENGAISVKIEIDVKTNLGFGKKKPPTEYLKLSVADTGPGIPLKFKEKIFERFYKLPSQSLGNRMGAGIGLAFTKSLVDLHHGQIKVTSKSEIGTTFKILLPLNKESYSKEELHKNTNIFPEITEKIDPLVAENKHQSISQIEISKDQLNEHFDRAQPLLLIVDDHDDLRSYINRYFTPDYQIVEASNGKEGIQKTLEYMPDLIISDISMPNIDGITLCKKLKSEEQTSHIPIILLTAKASQESELVGLQTGADAYVTKPFNMEALKTRVQNILKVRNELRKRFRKEIFLEPSEITVTSVDETFLKKAIKLVEDNMSNTEFTVDEMVREMAVSRSKLYLKLKALSGQSTSEFIRTIRLKRAVQLFDQTDYSVKEIMYMTGFNTSSYFSKCFKKQFGVVPSDYLKNKHKVKEENQA